MLAIERIKPLTRQSLSPIKKFETTDCTDFTTRILQIIFIFYLCNLRNLRFLLSNIKGESFYYGDKQKRLKVSHLKPKDSKHYFCKYIILKEMPEKGVEPLPPVTGTRF